MRKEWKTGIKEACAGVLTTGGERMGKKSSDNEREQGGAENHFPLLKYCVPGSKF